MGKFELETMLAEATKLPMVRIDRELFLRKELRNRYSKEVVDKAIEYNPAYAGITVEDIDKIAKTCINAETKRVTALSTLAGLPGGIGMIGTVPADLAQYFGHILRIMQELIYLYGWQDLGLDENELNEETKDILTLFLGLMFGVNGAAGAIKKISEQAAKQIVKKLPQKALTRGIIYPIVKKVALYLGIQMNKEIFARSVSKAVPVIGAAVSGGITFATYKPMAEKLRKYLLTYEVADNEFYKKLEKEEKVVDVNRED